jgi:FKBP-type peptidyl-prolyl cis-trans isomerase 2
MPLFTVGERVIYFHSFFNRRFEATVTRVTKTRVVLSLNHPPAGVQRIRSLTHKQADQMLERN